MKIAAVVPSCRENEIVEFLESWDDEFSRERIAIYVVQDSESKSFKLVEKLKSELFHLSWQDAPPGMMQCINVRSPGCRQIGFWKAYQDGCDIIITLDDDVRPISDSKLISDFSQILCQGIPRWVDPMLNYRSRGYPLQNVGRIPVDMHVGSFLGIPDVDAEVQLRHQDEFEIRPPQYQPKPFLLAQDQFMPVNGGIVGWKRELTPYLHYTVWDSALQYRRFDDIWMGVILKLVFDLCGKRISYGPPFVRHQRASNAISNLEYEREGKKWNELFWQQLADKVGQAATDRSYSIDAAFELVTNTLATLDSSWAVREAEALRGWRALFN